MLSKLKIAQRLLLGFGVILALLVCIALLAKIQVSGIATRLAVINDVNSVKQRYAINFRGSVHDRAINLRDVTLASTAAELDGFAGTIERLADAYAKSATPLDAMMAAGDAVTPDEQEIIGTIKQSEAKTMPLVAEIIRLQKSGDAGPAKKLLMEQARPAFIEWLGHINQFIDLEEAKNKAVGTEARGIAANFTWLIIAVCAGALLLGLAVAAWSLRTIKPLREITKTMQGLAAGDFSIVVPSLARRDEIGGMATALQTLKLASVEKLRFEKEVAEARERADKERALGEATRAQETQRQGEVVQSLAVGLSRLTQGDLVFRLTDRFPPEYETLRADFNGAIEQLQSTMGEISGNTAAIRSGTSEISSASDDLSRRTEQQAASLEETAAALDEITATVKKTSDGSVHARTVVSNTKADAERSGVVVGQAVEAMSAIEQSAQKVTQIIGVIDEIAFQTNLLALNAGVEAARAGEAGRGFAVVASEVRALAQRSAEAAKEIKALISTSSQQVSTGVDLVNETGDALKRIVSQVAEINVVVSDIATSTQEQATALQEVNTAINQMDQVTQQNAAMVEESTAAAKNLAQETEELARLVGRFELGQATGASRASAPRAKPRPAPARGPVAALKTAGQGGGAARKPEPDAQAWEEF